MPEPAASDVFVVIVAAPSREDAVVVGAALGERGRRAATIAGVPGARVIVVRDLGSLAAARACVHGPLIVVNTTAQVVMPELVEALVSVRGTRVAVDSRGQYAGALRVESERLADAWRDIGDDLTGGDAALAGRLLAESTTTAVEIDPLARHPAANPAELREASRWLFQFGSKPELDSTICRYFYRPVASPLTRLFVRLPFTPNMITVVAITLGQLGCVIAARPGYRDHVVGLFFIAFLSGILDCVDGEVARLRLQRSKLGAWLDAIGDDILRVSLILAVGFHVDGNYPGLPIQWITVGSVALTVLAMLPMYWYCIAVLHSPNIQTYRAVLSGSDGKTPSVAGFVGKIGTEVAGRDFIDFALFVLAVLNIPLVGVIGLAIGSAVAFVFVIPMHLKAMRIRKSA